MKPLLIAAACAITLTDVATAQQVNRGFAAITVADLAQAESWYQAQLGMRRLSASRAPSGVAQNVVIGNDYLVLELIHFTAKASSDTVIKDVRQVGLQKVGIWVAPAVFDSVFAHLTSLKATFLGGVITDNNLAARTFIVRDHAGVLLQYFASMGATQSRSASGAHGTFFALSVPDLDASRDWYVDKLGLRVTMEPPAMDGIRVAILEGDGLTVELIDAPNAKPQNTNPVSAHGIFKAGIVVDDLDALLARLRARGVATAFGPFPARDGQRANFAVRDNAGNLIQFFGR